MNLLKTFLYFAIFKYPLTKQEALNFCQYPTENIDEALEELLSKKLLFKIGEYYLPINEKSWVDRRKKGNELAAKKMKKAKRLAGYISRFPLVRSVMISGSLSKGYMDDESDIDFFVIMTSGNMAIPKALLGISRRLFDKSLCVNYVISEDNLSMEKQNIYTATEMATLIPIKDTLGLFDRFMDNNAHWVKEFLPNFNSDLRNITYIEKGTLKSFFEGLTSTKLGTLINTQLRKIYKRLAPTYIQESDLDYYKSSDYEDYSITEEVFKMHCIPYHTKVMNQYLEYVEILDTGKKLEFNENFYG